MADRPGNLGPRQLPIQSWRTRPAADVRHWRPYLPEVHIILGRDEEGSGLTISAWEPTAGEFASVRTVYAARWGAPVHSTEEALHILLHGLTAALAELFGPELPL